jgi:DNA-3-methyladenine glycosylase
MAAQSTVLRSNNQSLFDSIAWRQKQMEVGEPIKAEFFDACVDEVAAALIGCFLFAGEEKDRVGGKIIDTEAYCQNDPAAHCHKENDSRCKKEFKNGVCLFENGKRQKGISTRMHDSMYRPGGYIYVYPKSDYCYLNFSCGKENFGSGVLIRALEAWPNSIKLMKENRKKHGASAEWLRDPKSLCSGPNMLCQALGVTHAYDDVYLYDIKAPLRPLKLYKALDKVDVLCDSRVGLTKAKDWPRRYVLAGSLLGEPLTHDAKRYSRTLMEEQKRFGELKNCSCIA